VAELGADEVVDHRTTKLPDLGRFDVVIDLVGSGYCRSATIRRAPRSRS
jgi:hypothetical protein